MKTPDHLPTFNSVSQWSQNGNSSMQLLSLLRPSGLVCDWFYPHWHVMPYHLYWASTNCWICYGLVPPWPKTPCVECKFPITEESVQVKLVKPSHLWQNHWQNITTGWWFGTFFIFPYMGISSSQLTNSIIFQRARAQPPTRNGVYPKIAKPRR